MNEWTQWVKEKHVKNQICVFIWNFKILHQPLEDDLGHPLLATWTSGYRRDFLWLYPNYHFLTEYIEISKISINSQKMVLDTRHRWPGCPGIDGTFYDCIVTQVIIFQQSFIEI